MFQHFQKELSLSLSLTHTHTHMRAAFFMTYLQMRLDRVKETNGSEIGIVRLKEHSVCHLVLS